MSEVSNADMPAMPIIGTNGSPMRLKEIDKAVVCVGLTKRETFAMNAPIMPAWFEMEFLQNTDLNGGNDYVVVCGGVGDTSTKGHKAMFMAWPVYYAKALLAKLEEGNE